MNYNIETLSKLDSRKTVGYVLSVLHKNNDKVVAVYADVGSRFGIKGELNDKELEIGIAEQSLIPILGGMAHEGYIPYGIAYAPFLTMRAADQIRMIVGQMGLHVILVGGSAGLVSGNLGAASLALDDIALMRAIPNITIMSPSDSLMEAYMLDLASKIENPSYIRLTGGELAQIYNDFDSFCFGKAIELCKEGEDAVIYSTGSITSTVLGAAKILSQEGIKVTVVDVPFIKPLDTKAIDKHIDYPIAFTVEEHNTIGGLYGSISECLASRGKQKVIPIGIGDNYLYPDSYDNLLKASGLDESGIVRKIESYIGDCNR